MDHASHVLLACPGLALEQDRHAIAFSEFSNLLHERLHGRTVRDDAIERIALHILTAVQLDLSA